MDTEVSGVLIAAHELKAPLATLRQLALSFDNLNLEDEKLRTEMVQISDRAIKQVNDLTKISRLEDGLFAMEPVAVRAVCDDVTRELQTLFKTNHRGLEIKYTNRARLVSANYDLLRSVIYNFLLNAIHYSDESSHSELTVRDEKGKVRVDIRDFGPALPAHLWREIKRGELDGPTSIAMRPGSSGLGLYIASKFSHYMHADVGAIRHRDGASFYVSLPVSKQGTLFA